MFKGFPTDAVSFLQELSENNSKDWFNTHKKRFKSQLEAPAKEFAADMESHLGQGWKSKIFRIYRDLRFSKDKTPYNTHLRIGFTKDGEASLFFSLEPDQLILGSGVFEFSKQSLPRYRDAVAGSAGEELDRLLADYQSRGYRLDEPELKKVPRGYDSEHTSLLRRKSLALWKDDKVPKVMYSDGAVRHCLSVFEDLADFRDWLRGVL